MKFTDSVLSRLRLRLEEAPEEPRRVLAREVCCWLGWFFSDGRPKVSSCMKAFSILNKKKVVNFPKIEKDYAFQTRKAHPKTLALPPIACKLSDAGLIELVVVGKKNSKSFKIWNQTYSPSFYYFK